jgi:O-antigen/teichoic acid export membrane protein
MGIILAFSAFAGPFLIVFIFGSAFSPAGKPFLWLLPGIFGFGISRVLSADFNGRGRPQYITLSSFIAAGITLVLDLALIPHYGMLGAAQASSAVYLVNAMILVLWTQKQNALGWRPLLVPTRQDVIEILQFGKSLSESLRRG